MPLFKTKKKAFAYYKGKIKKRKYLFGIRGDKIPVSQARMYAMKVRGKKDKIGWCIFARRKKR